jgi:hypothetical protein
MRTTGFLTVMLMILITMTAKAQVGGFDPENPGDPQVPVLKYNLTIETEPSNTGQFYVDDDYYYESISLEPGKKYTIQAINDFGYSFLRWKNEGKEISRQRSFEFTMPAHDVKLVAEFEYDPQNPSDPSIGSWNPETGEVIVAYHHSDYLYQVIFNIVGEDNIEQVRSVILEGELNDDDIGWSFSYFPNLEKIDFSRVSGLTIIDSYQFSIDKLKSIILPSTIESIGYSAFYGCSQLESITCWALEPPAVNEYSFEGLSPNLVVYVPISALALYSIAEGWKDMTLLAIQDGYDITVKLPETAKPADYAQMSIQVTNAKNAQRQRLVMGDAREYVFHGIYGNSIWNVAVLNNEGTEFGRIDSVAVDNSSVTVAFNNLLRPQTVRLTVRTPEGKDVTSLTEVTWTDTKGNYIAHTSEVLGRVPGEQLIYNVQLSDSMFMTYGVPSQTVYTVTDGENNVVLTLEPHSQSTIMGKVADANDGLPIYGATVTAVQSYRDGLTASQLAHTDNEGTFIVETDNVSTVVTVSHNNYISQSISVDPGTHDLGNIVLTPISGAVITTEVHFTHCPDREGNVKEDDEYNDLSNVDFSVKDLTSGSDLDGVIVQNGQIILPEGVSAGDQIQLTATSLNKMFMPVSVTTVINDNLTAAAHFQLKELGRIEAQFASSLNAGNVGILYDGEGRLLKTVDYEGSQLHLRNVSDGVYTLVTMGKSDFYNGVDELSKMNGTLLSEGTDYVINHVAVSSGNITTVDVGDVPSFDESKFYYTSNEYTKFVAKKSDVSVGKFQTLCAGVLFRGEYAEQVTNTRLVVEIPDGCQLVQNSLICGGKMVPYDLDGNKMSFDAYGGISNSEWRFCVIPLEGGNVSISGFVEFNYDGRMIRQPIGHANFRAENMKMVAPKTTASEMVYLMGYAQASSEVEIYDGGHLIATTITTNDGIWSSQCQLNNAYPYSIHELQAKIHTSDGLILKTDVQRVEHNVNAPQPSKVVMYYYNKYMGTTYVITYDMIKPSKTPQKYYFYPSSKDFTFTIDFTENDTTKIKNVVLYVRTQNGHILSLEPQFDPLSGHWIAEAQFENGSSGNFPVNVSLNYDCWDHTSVNYTPPVEDDVKAFEAFSESQINTIIQSTDIHIYEDTPDHLTLLCRSNSDNMQPYLITITPMDYDRAVSMMSEQQFLFTQEGEGLCCMLPQMTDSQFSVIYIDTEEKYAFSLSMEDSKDEVFNNLMMSVGNRKLRGGKVLSMFTSILELPNKFNYLIDRYRFASSQIERLKSQAEYIDKFDDYFLNTMKSDCAKILTPEKKKELYTWRNEIMSKYLEYFDQVTEIANNYKKTFGYWALSDIAFTLCGDWLGDHVEHGVDYIQNLDNGFLTRLISGRGKMSRALKSMMESGMNVLVQKVVGNIHQDIIIPSLGVDFPKWEKEIANFEINRFDQIFSELLDFDLRAFRYLSLDCWRPWPPKPEPEPDFPNGDLDVAIDPSGFVYEAVPSNRVEGVTATIYYKEVVEDMYGDKQEKAVKWNASEYDQKNPLFTDALGMYRWDVPQGLWQVRFEKDGYESTATDWLPVPPPQLDINVPIIQNRQAEVKSAHAYEDAVEVEFTKYMMPELLDITNIKVLVGDRVVDGTVSLLDLECDSISMGQCFARKARFQATAPFNAEEVTLWVSNRVKSYAGIRMQDDFLQKFRVEKGVKTILCDSLVTIAYGQEEMMEVLVQPAEAAAGKILRVVPSSSVMLQVDKEEVEIGSDGKATVLLRGMLPGMTSVRFVLDGYDIEATAAVKVSQTAFLATAAPLPSIVSGSVVTAGTEVYIYCSTPDAVIYYTTDGSCPCDNSPSRMIYDGSPIIIQEYTVIKAMAVAPGRMESEVVTFIYQVISDGIAGVMNGSQMKVYPLPARNLLHIEMEHQIVERVSISSVEGTKVMGLNTHAEKVAIDVGSLPTGIYVLDVTTNMGRQRRKIVKW